MNSLQCSFLSLKKNLLKYFSNDQVNLAFFLGCYLNYRTYRYSIMREFPLMLKDGDVIFDSKDKILTQDDFSKSLNDEYQFLNNLIKWFQPIETTFKEFISVYNNKINAEFFEKCREKKVFEDLEIKYRQDYNFPPLRHLFLVWRFYEFEIRDCEIIVYFKASLGKTYTPQILPKDFFNGTSFSNFLAYLEPPISDVLFSSIRKNFGKDVSFSLKQGKTLFHPSKLIINNISASFENSNYYYAQKISSDLFSNEYF